jgi:uncharacterized membrane protein
LLVLRRRGDDERQLLTVIAVAMGFIAMVFPLQAEGGWITVGWAVQAALLAIFGMRVRSVGLRLFGLILMALALGRLLGVDLMHYDEPSGPLPFMHPYGLSSLLVAAAVWAVVIVGRRLRANLTPPERPMVVVAAVGGIVLVWLLVTIEGYTYLRDQFNARSAQTGLSAVWAAYAVVLLAAGFRARSAALRWGALGLFAFTLAKVFLLDMSLLPGFYRVAAFFVLALMMGIAAWAYQRFSFAGLGSGAEGDNHEAV